MKNITIAGNCTKDAELRTTQNGHKVASFGIAVNGFSGGAKTTTFFDVSIFGKRGESVMQFAKKGAKMCVTGDLGTHESNGKTYLDVTASDFTPLGGGQQSDNGGGYGGQQYSGYGSGGGGNSGYGGGYASDDLDQDSVPF